jgi:hypothetical protein
MGEVKRGFIFEFPFVEIIRKSEYWTAGVE